MISRNIPPKTPDEIIGKAKKIKKRVDPRISGQISVKFRPNTSSGGLYDTNGTLHNFSRQGLYIETSKRYLPGTILILRTILAPSESFPLEQEEQPPSFSLAEVKWLKPIIQESTIRFGMGLRYLF